MIVTAAERDLIAIGTLASHLRCSVRMIESTTEKLGMAPAWRFNMVPHYDGAQVEVLRAALSEGKA